MVKRRFKIQQVRRKRATPYFLSLILLTFYDHVVRKRKRNPSKGRIKLETYVEMNQCQLSVVGETTPVATSSNEVVW